MTPEFCQLYETALRILSSEDIDFRELGKILLSLVECLKQEILEVFPPPEKPRILQNREKVENEPPAFQDSLLLDFDFLYEYTPKVGRPIGSKTMTLGEFFQEYIPLHKETDFVEKAKEILQLLKTDNFKLKTLQDFIALLFAYQLFENEIIIEEFLNSLSN